MIVHMIIIWLVGWLIITATLSYIYKWDGWLMRYLSFVFLPITLIALLISCEIIRRLNNKEKSFRSIFLYFINLIATGKDEPIEKK